MFVAILISFDPNPVSDKMIEDESSKSLEFEDLSREPEPGLLREIRKFIVEEKLWWMSPIILTLVLLGMLVALTSTGAAPFIYTLF